MDPSFSNGSVRQNGDWAVSREALPSGAVEWTRRRFLVVGGGASAALVLGVACTEDGDGGTPSGAVVPEPEAVLITRWANDPWARGSYSYLPPGASPDDRLTLAAPLADRLFFAGEATSVDNPATVHGAVESGRRAAEEVSAAVPTGSRVLVVGAGAAGLAAGQALLDDGYDVLVVEARDRTGGRVWTGDLDGTPVDLGASWIHGTDGNPLSEIVDEAGIETVVTDYDSITVYGPDGFELDEATLTEAEAQVEAALAAAAELAEEVDEDQSLGSALDDELGELDGDEALLAASVITAQVEHEYAADADELSLFWWDEGEGYGGDDVVFPQGYTQVLDGLAPDVEVQLEQPVTTISWGEGGAVVATEDDEYEADAVIVTLPLGVLQEGGPEFQPPLPDDKQAAIGRLGMGVLDKVYLQFATDFWDDTTLVGFINSEPRQFVEWLNLEPVTGEPILVGFNAGSVARSLEEESDEQTTERALDALRTIYDP
jgi:monoamine oxidase